MAGLAVGVVDEIVEEGQTAQGRGVAGILAHIEIVYVRITLDEELDAARPPRPVAQDGGGHEAPTEGLADDKGGGLALAESARREIPQRILAAAGFVDGRNLVLVVMNDCQKGVVGAVWQQSFLFDFAFCQRVQYLAGRSRGRPLAARALVHDAAVVCAALLLFDRLVIVRHSGRPVAFGGTVRVGAPYMARHGVRQSYNDSGNAWPFVRGQK